MNTMTFSNAMSEIDDKYIEEAIQYRSAKKKQGWLKWGAMAACFTVVLAMGVPYLYHVIISKGGPGQDDPLRPPNVIEYNGAYFEAVDMDNTQLLDAYNLPHEITADMVGAELGRGLDDTGERTDMLYQYTPYAEISTTRPNGDKRFQRAVYLVSDGDEYAFALFRSYVHFDINTHHEPQEMFVVYGVDSADDIIAVEIGGKEVSDPVEIEAFFEEIYYATSMGEDDYQREVYGNMNEAERKKLSEELADSVLEIRVLTAEGLVINNMAYYPTINHVYWGLNYYKLTGPINLR